MKCSLKRDSDRWLCLILAGCGDISIIVGRYLVDFILVVNILKNKQVWSQVLIKTYWKVKSFVFLATPFCSSQLFIFPLFKNFLVTEFVTLSKPVIQGAVQRSRNCWKSLEIFKDNMPFKSRQPVLQLETTHRRNRSPRPDSCVCCLISMAQEQ